ncbi:MAG: hypothetical protein M3304_01615 [Actinomycetota bacterium]|nr:hypothetical protein [Actinomycetota bacterium]
MSRKSHKIRRMRAVIALAATVMASLVLLVASASGGSSARQTSGPTESAAAATQSSNADRFDARDGLGIAVLLASLGIGTAAMLWNYAREKSIGWTSIGGGGRWS